MSDYFTSPADVAPATKVLSETINNLDAAIVSAFDKLPTEAQLKQGTAGYAVDTGTVNAYAIALPYAPASYTDGLYISFRVLNTNTITTPTINVNGLGVKSIRKANGSELNIGDLYVGAGVDARYSTATGYFHITGSAGVGAKGDTGTGITAQAVGFTLTGGTTPKTFTGDADLQASLVAQVAASQAEMEAGTVTALRTMTPARVSQAIAVLAPVRVAATQAQAEAGTADTVALTPLSANWHPGVAKAWVSTAGEATPTIATSWNITSITDGGTGKITVTIATDFSSADYTVQANLSGSLSTYMLTVNTRAAGAFSIYAFNLSGGAVDPTSFLCTCFGDQA